MRHYSIDENLTKNAIRPIQRPISATINHSHGNEAMQTIFSRTLLNSSVALSIALIAMVNADTAVAQERGADDALEEVIVTGSRLVRREVETTAPIAVIGAEDMLLSGETDITQLLRESPALTGYELDTDGF